MESIAKKYSGINADGSLKKFATPIPTSQGSKAASLGDINKLKQLSTEEILSVNEDGNTALIWAADKGQEEALNYILNVLVEAGQDEKEQACYLNMRGYLGNTALGRASRGGHVACVSALISQKLINPNICNEKMQYPLHFGAFKKHVHVVKELLKSGKCDTYVKDRKGRTPSEDTSVEEIRNLIHVHRETNYQ